MAEMPPGTRTKMHQRISTAFSAFFFVWLAIAMTLGLFYMAGCTLRAVQS